MNIRVWIETLLEITDTFGSTEGWQAWPRVWIETLLAVTDTSGSTEGWQAWQHHMCIFSYIRIKAESQIPSFSLGITDWTNPKPMRTIWTLYWTPWTDDRPSKRPTHLGQITQKETRIYRQVPSGIQNDDLRVRWFKTRQLRWQSLVNTPTLQLKSK